MNNSLCAGLALSVLAVFTVSAEEGGPKLAPLKAFANWEVSEIESFTPDAASTPAGYFRELSNASSVWILQEARLAENAKVFVGLGGYYFFILPSKSNVYSIGQRSAFGFTDLHAEFDFWTRENGDHGIRFKAGVFPYKYNANAKNLGEYMFRSYAYPTVLYTGGLTKVNGAGVQLNGINLGTQIDGFKNDILLTVKTDQMPSAALSLTEMISFSVRGIFTLGAGYMFDNFYDPTKIAGGEYDVRDYNKYYILADGTKKLKAPQFGTDVPFDPAVDVAVDSARISFQAQKAMVQASLDFGKLLESDLLSEKDLRLYFEAILLGVEDHPFYYTNIKDRLVYSLGFNFPTFRLLDILAYEVEYCSNPYPNDASNATLNLSPIPNSTGNEFNGDNLKWTVYAQRTLLPGFTVTGQVANDHMRLVDYFGHTNDRSVMPNRKNWYWALQLGFSL